MLLTTKNALLKKIFRLRRAWGMCPAARIETGYLLRVHYMDSHLRTGPGGDFLLDRLSPGARQVIPWGMLGYLV